jgi:hypothetical protein
MFSRKHQNSENEKRRLSGEYISQKPPEIEGSVVQVLRAKKNIFLFAPRNRGTKNPETARVSGFSGAISFLIAQHGALHQKRYFVFLCYRGRFLLYKPEVKRMTPGLFHF